MLMQSSRKDVGYYTAAEVAELLRVHVKTVRLWVSQGKLNAIRISQTIRIPKTELEEKKTE